MVCRKSSAKLRMTRLKCYQNYWESRSELIKDRLSEKMFLFSKLSLYLKQFLAAVNKKASKPGVVVCT
jgi:hypothetical protein